MDEKETAWQDMKLTLPDFSSIGVTKQDIQICISVLEAVSFGALDILRNSENNDTNISRARAPSP
jgi:hypothetical protein